MKSLIVSLFVSLSVFLTMSAQADEPEHAVVIRGDLCYVWVTAPNGDAGFVVGDQLHVNSRPGPNGFPSSGKITCHGTHNLELDRAITSKVSCYIAESPQGPLFTEKGRLILTPSSELALQCHFHAEKDGEV